MTKARRQTLGEICDSGGGEVKTGPFGSQLHQSDYTVEGTPVVMPKNIATGKIDVTDIARVCDDDVERLKQHCLAKNDIVYGRRGDIGRHALITDKEEGWLCGTGCLRISLGSSCVDARYLHYYLEQPSVIDWIRNQAIGATMPNLNTSILRSVSIDYPSLSAQHKIASILSAYDDLIENNQRRIAILEEMAQLIYREWFVHFRFPGHEKVKMVGSPIGRIPADWIVCPIANAFDVLGGGTPSKKAPEYWKGGTIDWYVPSDLTGAGTMFMDRSTNRISEEGLRKSSARLFAPYSVMMTSRATLGVFSINTSEACTNQGFITCLPNERVPLYFLFYWLKENIERFTSVATGAVFKEITKGAFKELDICIPPRALTSQFEELVTPLGTMILNLQRTNENLRSTRDILLPKLISGELDVSLVESPHNSSNRSLREFR